MTSHHFPPFYSQLASLTSHLRPWNNPRFLVDTSSDPSVVPQELVPGRKEPTSHADHPFWSPCPLSSVLQRVSTLLRKGVMWELYFDSVFSISKARFCMCVNIPPSTTWKMMSFISSRKCLPFLTRKINPCVATPPSSSAHNYGILFSFDHFPISRRFCTMISSKIVEKFWYRPAHLKQVFWSWQRTACFRIAEFRGSEESGKKLTFHSTKPNSFSLFNICSPVLILAQYPGSIRNVMKFDWNTADRYTVAHPAEEEQT